MIKILASTFLMIKLVCQRLDVDWELALALWRNRPAIEIVQEDPAARRQALHARIDAAFPF